jgi:hypothetical protein
MVPFWGKICFVMSTSSSMQWLASLCQIRRHSNRVKRSRVQGKVWSHKADISSPTELGKHWHEFKWGTTVFELDLNRVSVKALPCSVIWSAVGVVCPTWSSSVDKTYSYQYFDSLFDFSLLGCFEMLSLWVTFHFQLLFMRSDWRTHCIDAAVDWPVILFHSFNCWIETGRKLKQCQNLRGAFTLCLDWNGSEVLDCISVAVDRYNVSFDMTDRCCFRKTVFAGLVF